MTGKDKVSAFVDFLCYYGFEYDDVISAIFKFIDETEVDGKEKMSYKKILYHLAIISNEK